MVKEYDAKCSQKALMQQLEKENQISNLSNLNANASTNVTMGGPI